MLEWWSISKGTTVVDLSQPTFYGSIIEINSNNGPFDDILEDEEKTYLKVLKQLTTRKEESKDKINYEAIRWF
jgi:hypothetical protein